MSIKINKCTPLNAHAYEKGGGGVMCTQFEKSKMGEKPRRGMQRLV